jgi:hypothetical protein
MQQRQQAAEAEAVVIVVRSVGSLHLTLLQRFCSMPARAALQQRTATVLLATTASTANSGNP